VLRCAGGGIEVAMEMALPGALVDGRVVHGLVLTGERDVMARAFSSPTRMYTDWTAVILHAVRTAPLGWWSGTATFFIWSQREGPALIFLDSRADHVGLDHSP